MSHTYIAYTRVSTIKQSEAATGGITPEVETYHL